MKKYMNSAYTRLSLWGMLVITSCFAATSEAPVRERISFNDDWRFQKEDPKGVGRSLDYFEVPEIKKAILDSASSTGLNDGQKRLGEKVSYVLPSYDDRSWRKVSLPHDWGIEGPFDQKLDGATGKLPWAGIGWYRKSFTLPASDKGRRIYLDIDGAMAYSMVWCNGRLVGGWPYGYSSFRLDLTDDLKPGEKNQLAIRLNNPDQSSRWYPGSGLYRNVWLVKTNPLHVTYGGAAITTPEVKADGATIALRLTLKNKLPSEVRAKSRTEIFPLDSKGIRSGSPVAEMSGGEISIPAGGEATASFSTRIQNPNRWSTQTPHLYQAVTTVREEGRVVDLYETTFGIRQIEFKADEGFFLNGERVRFQGVCNHHDLGALGAAFNLRAAERQLEIMKEMGVNALRTSHNMPAPELLDLCDRMGILVMDESFDCWKQGKKVNDYSRLWDDWHEKDLRALIRRDLNHPSVVMWSIGNEVRELGDSAKGPAIAKALTAIVHDADPTRPSVLGSNNHDASYNGVQKGVDVMGQNYEIGGYAPFKKENPKIPLVGSETSSCVSSRGEYFFQTPEMARASYDLAVKKAKEKGEPAPKPTPFVSVSERKSEGLSNFQVSSYDLYGPGWSWTPDDEFKSLDQHSFVAGEFVWTGFDYLGEPTPYNDDMTNLLNFHDEKSKAEMERQLKALGKIEVPSRSSYFGIVDLAGFKKDRFYLYQSRWRPDYPMAHLLPHWNWPEREGLATPVHLYTSGDEAELFLNGKSLGRKKKGPLEYRFRWNDVIYTPGELRAVVYKNGKEWAQDLVKTAGPAAKLTLEPDRRNIRNDADDLSFITVRIADKEGVLVPRSKNLVQFEISGPGEIVAVDNGDATSHQPFQASRIKAYNGMALVIVRAKKDQTGNCIVKATSESLQQGTTTLEIGMSK